MNKSVISLRRRSGNNSNNSGTWRYSISPSPVAPNTRSSSKRRSGNTTSGVAEQEEATHLEDPRGQNEQLLGEKGLTNRQLLGGPVTDPSGCLSSSKTLLRGNPSSATSQAPASEETQSIPETSRSKRVRVATATASPCNHNTSTIGFTGRTTRSSVSSTSSHHTSTLQQSTRSSQRSKDNSSDISSSKQCVSKTSISESGKSVECSIEEGTFCLKEESECSVREIEAPPTCESLHNLEKTLVDAAITVGDINNSSSGILDSDSCRSPKGERGSSRNQSHADVGVGGGSDCGSSRATIAIRSGTEKVVNTNDHDESESRAGTTASPFTERDVTSIVKGNSSQGGSRSKVINENIRHSSPAPMLLMNNLPYMGELTFDTRPRRGRKPKKADICHLISKNYGIHFPISYTNEPNTGSNMGISSVNYSNTTEPAVPKKSPSTRPVNKASSKAGKKYSSLRALPTGNPSWEVSPPDLLPITFSGRNYHDPSSSSWIRQSTSSQKPDSNSSPYLVSKSFKSSKNCAPIATQTSHTEQTHKRSNRNEGASGSVIKSDNQEEPLNLCMRDSSSQMGSQIRLTLSDFNAAYAGAGGMKLPMLSPAGSLFSDFHLNQSRRNTKGSLDNKKFRSSSGSGSNRSIDAKSVNDLTLVNNTNLRLSPSSDGLGRHKSSKQRGKVSQGIKFAPPITMDDTAFQRSHSHGKGKQRRVSPMATTLKSEYDQHVSSVSSGTFLNNNTQPSFAQASASSVSTGDSSHTGGCLFGQSDSGPSSSAQVSICKFKFTGGAKPSLQEKKMLSVDSGGNFRFYTDKIGPSSVKSMKSCQSNASPSSSTFHPNVTEGFGDQQDCQYAFSSLPKSAKSMSVCMPVRPTSLKIPPPAGSGKLTFPSSSKGTAKNESQSPSALIPLSPAARDLHNLRLDGNQSQLLSPSAAGDSTSITFPQNPAQSQQSTEDGYSSSQSDNSSNEAVSHGQDHDQATSEQYLQGESSGSRGAGRTRSKRKRRTRKSLMREKLEKTFKEKGFLIQTQQLESAEGATYCKFRQLRKFTRYLFRSWKDYLPDNVREINNSGANEEAGSGSASSINLTTTGSGNLIYFISKANDSRF
jgi:hypothetical protein